MVTMSVFKMAGNYSLKDKKQYYIVLYTKPLQYDCASKFYGKMAV